MLPEIKTRLRTEELCRRNEKSFEFIKKKLPKRNSIVNACLHYLQELKRSSIQYSPQRRLKKPHKRQRVESDVTSKNIHSITRA